MRWIGDGLDAVTAFAGAAVATMALFLPFTLTLAAPSSPYRVTSLINSVPRGVALGLIIAVVTAVLLYPATRTVLSWLIAAAGSALLLLNHVVGQYVSSADVLTTQNYLDSLFGGVVLGALGISAPRRPWTAFGYAVGAVTTFVFVEVDELVAELLLGQQPVLESPKWVATAATILLVLATVRHRHGMAMPPQPRLAAELPLVPIIAATVLAGGLLGSTEWLSQQFDGSGVTVLDLGLAAGATVAAAAVTAMLLPDRDGLAVLLAVALATVGDAFADLPEIGRPVPIVVAVVAAGVLAGRRLADARVAFVLVLAAAGIGILAARYPGSPAWAAGIGVLALAAGYACGATPVHYPPTAVLALGTLFLPTVAWAIPTAANSWRISVTLAAEQTPALVALGIVIGLALAAWGLLRLRPRPVPVPDEVTEMS